MNVCGFQIIYLDTVVSRGLRLTVVSSAGPEAPKKLDTVVSRDLRLTVILSAGPEAPKSLTLLCQIALDYVVPIPGPEALRITDSVVSVSLSHFDFRLCLRHQMFLIHNDSLHKQIISKKIINLIR